MIGNVSQKAANTRVASGVAAHLYSQAVTVLTQLVSLPILLSYWSPQQYGQWVVISAIPVYLSLADVGIVTAAANLMSMHRARGELADVRRVFQSGLVIILMIVPTIAAIVGGALLAFDFGVTPDQRIAVFELTLASLLTVACGLFDAAYRPFGKYPKVTVLLTSARILEWLGLIFGVVIFGNLAGAGGGFLCGRALAVVVIFAFAQHDVPNISWRLAGIEWCAVRGLLRTGAGFVWFTFGNLLTLQGMVILVGSQLGALSAAIFSTSRTLTRLLAQVSVLAGKALAPELAAMYGANNHSAFENLSRRVAVIVMSITMVGAAGLAQFGQTIIRLWSHGKIPYQPLVFHLLLASAVATAYWQIGSIRLTATNQHQFLAVVFLGASILAIAVTYLGAAAYGLTAAAAGSCIADFAMVIGTGVAVRRSTAKSRRVARAEAVL